MIAYRDTHDLDLDALGRLREACGFATRTRAELAQQIAGARWVVSAWDEARLVGFARAVRVARSSGRDGVLSRAWFHRRAGNDVARPEELNFFCNSGSPQLLLPAWHRLLRLFSIFRPALLLRGANALDTGPREGRLPLRPCGATNASEVGSNGIGEPIDERSEEIGILS